MSKKVSEMTEEERQKKRDSQRRWLEKKKKELMKNNAIAETVAVEAAPNYEELYETVCKENAELKLKVEQLTQFCKTFAEKEDTAKRNLAKATLEYNARVKYMLDCVRHALMSIQFAYSAGDTKEMQND